mgnify:CR=1 FL=1
MCHILIYVICSGCIVWENVGMYKNVLVYIKKCVVESCVDDKSNNMLYNIIIYLEVSFKSATFVVLS